MMPAPPRQPWDDDYIDQALTFALAVDPSPTFRARVRARLADEPIPVAGRGRGVWSVGAAAAAGVLLAVVLAMPRADRPLVAPTLTPADVPASASSPARGGTPAAVPPPAIPRSAEAEGGRVSRLGAVGPQTTALPSDQRVSARFDPRDREAFAWVLSFSASGLLSEPTALAPFLVDQEPTVSPIVISAIDVAPIDVSGGDEGEPTP